jgi:hypothetical protein
VSCNFFPCIPCVCFPIYFFWLSRMFFSVFLIVYMAIFEPSTCHGVRLSMHEGLISGPRTLCHVTGNGGGADM